MTSEELEMVNALVALASRLSDRVLRCTCGPKEAAPPEKKRSSSAARMAKHRHNKRYGTATCDTGSDTKAVTSDNYHVVSSKEDLERGKEPFKALSPTLYGVSTRVTRSATPPSHVTTETVTPNLNIDVTATDRDWRAMIRQPRGG